MQKVRYSFFYNYNWLFNIQFQALFNSNFMVLFIFPSQYSLL